MATTIDYFKTTIICSNCKTNQEVDIIKEQDTNGDIYSDLCGVPSCIKCNELLSIE